jgi:hypothetical protein
VEGALVEAVRQGSSDIHIIAKEGNRTEFWFRTDGSLKIWHVQEKTTPEAVAAVVKDRSKNVDRFEREMSQDGFIQRLIDDHMIRFRVSIMPIVGIEFRHKFESIVIRVLDDRKVITDLSKLGLQGPARDFFYKAIARPQDRYLTGPTGRKNDLDRSIAPGDRSDGQCADGGRPVEYADEPTRPSAGSASAVVRVEDARQATAKLPSSSPAQVTSPSPRCTTRAEALLRACTR